MFNPFPQHNAPDPLTLLWLHEIDKRRDGTIILSPSDLLGLARRFLSAGHVSDSILRLLGGWSTFSRVGWVSQRAGYRIRL